MNMQFQEINKDTKHTILTIIALAAAAKLLAAALLTRFVLVDDAYITLRYARNLVETGHFAYNSGEAILGITTPLYGLLASVAYALWAPGVEVILISVNILLWSWGTWVATRLVDPGYRITLAIVLSITPLFVDNQMLGMETSLFVLLLIGAVFAVLRDRWLTIASLVLGLALITRPEAILLAPSLLYAYVRIHGLRVAAKRVLRPLPVVLLLAPGIAWTTYALAQYGTVVPQSMLSKSGWSSSHYDELFYSASTLHVFPRLTFVPFIDHLPKSYALALTVAIVFGVLWVVWANVHSGYLRSHLWLGFYSLYMIFYIAGKGATEASWYSIPSSVALLFAAEPAIRPIRFFQSRVGVMALGLGLLLPSCFLTIKRAEALHYYVESYGSSAHFLNEYAAQKDSAEPKIAIGEIGVFGWMTSSSILDLGALVSPEVLAMKEEGWSFIKIMQDSDVDYFVISQRALEHNDYPTIGPVWASDEEHKWLKAECRLIGNRLDKRIFEVLPR